MPLDRWKPSGSHEWWTPAHVIDAARDALGRIELDPASCSEANIVVGADEFYTREDDGLSKDWGDKNLWCNPPWAAGDLRQWIPRVVAHPGKRLLLVPATDSTPMELVIRQADWIAWFRGLQGWSGPDVVNVSNGRLPIATAMTVVAGWGCPPDSFRPHAPITWRDK